jgi:hypothetical protein
MGAPRSQCINGVSIILLIAGLISSGGCAAKPFTQSTPYLPPASINRVSNQTPAIISTPQPMITSQPLQPSPAGICSNNLLYLQDLTITDWTILKPGTPVDKQWRIENGGTCNWDDRYSLRLVSGDDLGVETIQGLYPARAGTQAVIHINFTAPIQSGTYNSVWQAYDPLDQPFGDPISILVVIE